MTANYLVHGVVAVIRLNNPPVNCLGLLTRIAVVDAILRALADPAVKAILLTGAGNAFSGGADIKEFNAPQGWAEPSLHTLIDMAEQSTKPVVVAIHTLCMGGGLELSLGCHYRIAASGARMALPEVKIGLLPGAGGTQRLPRALGLARAIEMIVSGAPVPAEELADSGLFDLVVTSVADLMPAALDFATRIADVRPLPRVRDRDVDLGGQDFTAFLVTAREQVAVRAGRFPAPMRCLDAVAASVTMPFEQGMRVERAGFFHLLDTIESHALRHVFFAERLAGKVPGLPADTPLRAIHRAAVVGAGTMGGGIAMTFANAGMAVRLLDTTQAKLDQAMAAIGRHYASAVEKGKLSKQESAQRLALISTTLAYEDLAGADIVVEAVFEDMAAKLAVFTRLDQVMPPGALLASNTSTLDLDRIAAATGRPQDVIGLHFFSPAHVMKLLEIVRGAATSAQALATALALAKTLHKTGVVSGVCDGFIGNRMIEQYSRQAGFLLDLGCSPGQVDRAMENFGFAMGPFRMADLAGNDIGQAIGRRRQADQPELAYSASADLLCALGRLGQKTGAGWYDYHPGGRIAQPSAVVGQMLAAHCSALGVAGAQISAQEIVERLVYALVNEAAYILDEGIVLRASDIDMVYLSGYGFPLFRGGPMFYADTVGLPTVLAAVQSFADGYQGQVWTPAPLLMRLVEQGKSFNS